MQCRLSFPAKLEISVAEPICPLLCYCSGGPGSGGCRGNHATSRCGPLHAVREGTNTISFPAKVEEFRHQLFASAGADLARVAEFSCGENDSCIPVISGWDDVTLCAHTSVQKYTVHVTMVIPGMRLACK